MTAPAYETDFYAWTQAQAAVIRARAWDQVDVEHVAEEIEDLWKAAAHHLGNLLLGFIELIYRPSADEEGNYYWQSAVVDFERSMLERWGEDSEADHQRLLALLAARLPGAYAAERARLLRRRTPPAGVPPERCPWTLDQLLDEQWWPPEAPARLP
jgi:hypothetical protein